MKNIDAPNLTKIEQFIGYIGNNIENIIIEDITAPNINSLKDLIYNSSIETLNLKNIGNVNTHTIHTLIKNCPKLKTLEINSITQTKEINEFIEYAPSLESNIINKITLKN